MSRIRGKLASPLLLTGLVASLANAASLPASTTQPTGTGAPLPSGVELLAKLRSMDAVYRKGFTASGTAVFGLPSTKYEWQLTMADRRLALVHRALEILDQAENKAVDENLLQTDDPVILPLVEVETAVFLTPEFSALYMLTKPTPAELDGKGGTRSVYFYGPGMLTHHVAPVLWVLGRGLSEEIDQITKVRRDPNGMLTATATGLLGDWTWELRVDPRAGYLARSGKSFYFRFSNSGLQQLGRLWLPVEGEWASGSITRRLTLRSALPKADRQLLKAVEAMMHPPYPAGTRIDDERVWPDLVAEYKDNQVVAPISFVRPGHPDREKKLREQQAVPRRVAEAFLAAALAGKDKKAATLTAPGSAAASQLGALRELARGASVNVQKNNIFFAGSIVLVMTSDISPGPDATNKGPLLMRLIKQEDAWLVDRIDLRVTAPITRRVTDALGTETGFPGMI